METYPVPSENGSQQNFHHSQDFTHKFPSLSYPKKVFSENTYEPKHESKPSSKKLGGKKLFGLDPSVEEIDSVVLHDLHWWTSDRDIIGLCEQLGVIIGEKDVIFMEHKVNGKSKGQAVVNCRSKPSAIKLNEWLIHNMFQGKKTTSTLAASILGNPFHPNNQDFPAPRPLSSAIHNTMGQATNSHGGVNFNRVNKNLRVNNQAGLGNGRPPNHRQTPLIQNHQHAHSQHHPPGQAQHHFRMSGYPQPPQPMMMFPMDPSLTWGHNTDFAIPDYAPTFKPGLHMPLPDFYMHNMLPSGI